MIDPPETQDRTSTERSTSSAAQPRWGVVQLRRQRAAQVLPQPLGLAPPRRRAVRRPRVGGGGRRFLLVGQQVEQEAGVDRVVAVVVLGRAGARGAAAAQVV